MKQIAFSFCLSLFAGIEAIYLPSYYDEDYLTGWLAINLGGKTYRKEESSIDSRAVEDFMRSTTVMMGVLNDKLDALLQASTVMKAGNLKDSDQELAETLDNSVGKKNVAVPSDEEAPFITHSNSSNAPSHYNNTEAVDANFPHGIFVAGSVTWPTGEFVDFTNSELHDVELHQPLE